MPLESLNISGSNIKINFNESFKNIVMFFLYFDRSDFMYTGAGKVNRLIMSFEKGELQNYYSSELIYHQKFASYGLQKDRLTKEIFDIIISNQDFHLSKNL